MNNSAKIKQLKKKEKLKPQKNIKYSLVESKS